MQLKIRASDHAHGFKISEIPEGGEMKGKPGLVFAAAQDRTKIEEGKSETVEFVVQTPGTNPSVAACIAAGITGR